MIPEAGTHLPEEQQQMMRRATRLEWISIGYAACTITAVALVVGNSQAMRTAWIDDMLSVLPQVAFLLSGIYVRRSRRPTHPYGYHRTMSAGHLVAGVALLSVGAVLVYESVSALIKAEHPTIGTMNIAGHTIWQGWLMIAVMAVFAVPAVILGRLKIKAAKPLHNKLLYADASMAKADWQTNVASIVGVGGIGFGLWWLDSVAALVISAGIIQDGWKNTRSATVDLLDRRATSYDGKDPHPLIPRLEGQLKSFGWIKDCGIRARELGQVMHLEAFIVPISVDLSMAQIHEVKAALEDTDWKAYDVVVTPVLELPDFFSQPREVVK
ncbi:cation diffusion facilitator family transporter [Glutamicibacter sp.]|uniref:cation diffusion facilitator family transporter n=1 Tax=Glutamicibacter sp. TaxID=1931995 RepID=UPI002B463EA5|nr:cation diffusion facilitator family transporter [Glutamicibacter sp.]HJX77061.1 cation diffusion facilitator family transporter [Glutamicibacter sp.]